MKNEAINKTTEVFQIVSRGLGYAKDSDNFIVSTKNLNINLLLLPETLLPVLSGMTNILHNHLFQNEDNINLFPTLIKKKVNALCYATLADDENYKLETSGFSLTSTHLISMYVMENILMPNKQHKVDLTNLVNLWRSELANYEEGDIIDLRNHKEALVDFNLSKYPKIRIDLQDQRTSDFRKNIFN